MGLVSVSKRSQGYAGAQHDGARTDAVRLDERRHQILDAAGRVFLKKGFAAATMQDVAAEAGMSPGNLYRYFPAKDAIVAALIEADRSDAADKFAALAAAEDQLAAFEQLGRDYFLEEVCLNAPLTLEIWSAAGRDPALARLCIGIECGIRDHLIEFLGRAAAQGVVHPSVDHDALADLIVLLGDGVIKASAFGPAQDRAHAVETMFAVIRAVLEGRLALPPRAAAAPLRPSQPETE
jgi:AcrR family transcriptional regulator